MISITLITVGNKMPAWVNEGFNDYKKRLKDVKFNLVEIPLLSRHKGAEVNKLIAKETRQIEENIPKNAYLIALDLNGTQFSSENLACKLSELNLNHSHLCFIIGGPEGIANSLLTKASLKWSLSKLTMPHTIARLCFIEAIYRAYTILQNHPYHK